MEEIRKKIIVDCDAEKAFSVFINELSAWWPKDYTWSQDQLQDLLVEPKLNGLFSEIGPYGFRCDWGRIIEISSVKLVFLWQIGPSRTPEPNPDKASTVEVNFIREPQGTAIILAHRAFEKHGEGLAQNYRDRMNAPEGWDYILSAFVEYLITK